MHFRRKLNSDSPLQDEENRRYLPVPCIQGDLNWITSNRDQLWAEAVVRYKKGEKWWTTRDDLFTALKTAQDDARSQDPWEAILVKKLDGINKVTVAEAAELLNLRGNEIDRKAQMRIAASLKATGFEFKREAGGNRARYYGRGDEQNTRPF